VPSPAHLALALSVCVILAGLPFGASAYWIQQCEGPEGEITYTASNCPDDHTLVAQQPPKPANPAKVQRSSGNKLLLTKPRAQSKAAQNGPSSSEKGKKSSNTVRERESPLESKTAKKEKKQPVKYLPNRPAKG
jgi:hypothetical protein